jgi:hypothetical protein
VFASGASLCSVYRGVGYGKVGWRSIVEDAPLSAMEGYKNAVHQ